MEENIYQKKGYKNEENIYQKKGYKNRKDYLECLAADYCVPLDLVYALASMLGENEDFDGLISSLEDAEGMFDE